MAMLVYLLIDLADNADMCPGTVSKFTNRVFIAVISRKIKKITQ